MTFVRMMASVLSLITTMGGQDTRKWGRGVSRDSHGWDSQLRRGFSFTGVGTEFQKLLFSATF